MRSPINFYHLYHDTTAFTFFIKIGIWKISQIPRHLGKFPDTQAFGKFLFLTFLIIAVKPVHVDNATLRVV